jgi:lipopolysaccharide export system protein LptA
MAASILKVFARRLLAPFALVPLALVPLELAPFAWIGAQAAHAAAPPQAISLDAQSSELDYKNNNLIFRKVHISQGSMSVTADQAQATGLDFENSHWIFRGNVKITMEQGQLNSDEAEITFVKKLLSKAIVNGKPASFEQRLAKSGKLAQGHADSIDYDVGKGVVHFSRNAWLTNGDSEIHGDSLKYNILAQNIVAEAAEQGSQRVHIIITPPAKPAP